MKPKSSSLFCPSCGAEGQIANAYCNRCGEWLPDIKARARLAFGGETPQQNISTSLFMSASSAAAALFSAIALYATYLGTPEAKWSVDLAGAFCLCIAIWQISSFIVTLKLRRRLNQARGEGVTRRVEAKQPVPALESTDPSNFVSTPSITENTTELLEPVRREYGHSPPGAE